MPNDMNAVEAQSRLRSLQETLAAVCAVALKELERDGLDQWPGARPARGAEEWTAQSLLDLEKAVRILAAVADGETGLNVAGAVYLNPDDLTRIQGKDWFDEDVLFFTDCEACGGQLVSVGGGDGAPSSCAACADPSYRNEPDEVRKGDYGDLVRALFMTARIAHATTQEA